MPLKSANALPIHAEEDQHYREWLISPGGHHRDSDPIAECNHQVIKEAYERHGPEGEEWAILRFRHWAVGWVEEIVVLPGSLLQTEAEDFAKRLEEYPILDEMRLELYECEVEEDDDE